MKIAKVVELGAPNVAVGDDLDLGDRRCVEREGPLDAHTEAHLADGEGLLDACTLSTDDDALEDLDTLTGALDHAHVDLERVTWTEIRDVISQRVAVDQFGGVHGEILMSSSGGVDATC